MTATTSVPLPVADCAEHPLAPNAVTDATTDVSTAAVTGPRRRRVQMLVIVIPCSSVGVRQAIDQGVEPLGDRSAAMTTSQSRSEVADGPSSRTWASMVGASTSAHRHELPDTGKVTRSAEIANVPTAVAVQLPKGFFPSHN